MRKSVFILSLVLSLILAFSMPDISSAIAIETDGVTAVHLYETVDNTPNGTPSEIGPVVPLILPDPEYQTAFAVILESAPNDHSIANWSDVVKLDYLLLDGGVPTIGSTYVEDGVGFLFAQAQLFSDPEFGSVSGPILTPGSLVAWYPEDSTGVTSFFFGDFNIFVHSDPPGAGDSDPVPEPSTILLLGSGLLGLLGYGRKKFFKK